MRVRSRGDGKEGQARIEGKEIDKKSDVFNSTWLIYFFAPKTPCTDLRESFASF